MHQHAAEKVDMFKFNPDTRVDSCLYSARKEQEAENREVLCHTVNGVEFLYKQGLPLRGHRGEDKVDFR